MTIVTNVRRITSESDLATYYAQSKTSDDRVTFVADPLGQRGGVMRFYRHKDDPEVNSGLRQEIKRDVFVSEYALNTGGGIYWTSYMLADGFEKYPLLVEENPGTNYGILIKQFHPRNIDGFTHPKLSLVVTNRGVSIRNWGLLDASETTEAEAYERVVTWPVDTMKWHDVVIGVKWSLNENGQYLVWLDGSLVYRFHGQTIYSGASAGCWYSEGIYSPGGYPSGIDSLTCYSQGYRQGWPPTNYFEVMSKYPTNARMQYARNVEMRSTETRQLVSRLSDDGNIRM